MSLRHSLRRPHVLSNFPRYAFRTKKTNTNLTSGKNGPESVPLPSILIANRGEIAMSASEF